MIILTYNQILFRVINNLSTVLSDKLFIVKMRYWIHSYEEGYPKSWFDAIKSQSGGWSGENGTVSDSGKILNSGVIRYRLDKRSVVGEVVANDCVNAEGKSYETYGGEG